jgi:diguanylate cyclase (GGDEF)-like protein
MENNSKTQCKVFNIISRYKGPTDHGLKEEKPINERNTLEIKLDEVKRKSACLVVALGRYLGKHFMIESEDLIIGRRTDCDVSINDKSLSRTHAQIYRDKNRNLFIKDLKSTNGTQLNDKIIAHGESFPLKDGDLLKLGNIIFKFITGGSIENIFHADMLNLQILDDLVGVYDKKTIMSLLEDEFNMAKMAGQTLSLVAFDIDHFKSINETLGHLVGDFVLKETLKTLKKVVRQRDLIGRIGGKEFLIIFPSTSLLQIFDIAERMRQTIEQHNFVFEETNIPVTISLGVFSLDSSIRSFTDLFKKTDNALYSAQNRGGNKVAAF